MSRWETFKSAVQEELDEEMTVSFRLLLGVMLGSGVFGFVMALIGVAADG